MCTKKHIPIAYHRTKIVILPKSNNKLCNVIIIQTNMYGRALHTDTYSTFCAQIATPPPWAGQEHLPCLRPARLWTQAWAQKADYGRHPQAWLIDALNSRVSRRAWKYGHEHNQRWQIRSTLKPTDPNYARHGWNQHGMPTSWNKHVKLNLYQSQVGYTHINTKQINKYCHFGK